MRRSTTIGWIGTLTVLAACTLPAAAQATKDFRRSASSAKNQRAMPSTSARVDRACQEAKSFLHDIGLAGLDIDALPCDEAQRQARELSWKSVTASGSSSTVRIGTRVVSAAAQAAANKSYGPTVRAHGGVDPLGQAVKNTKNSGVLGRTAGRYVGTVGTRAANMINGQRDRGVAPAAVFTSPQPTTTTRDQRRSARTQASAAPAAPLAPTPTSTPTSAPTPTTQEVISAWVNRLAQSAAMSTLSVPELARLLEQLAHLAQEGRIAEGDALVRSITGS
jgi:hypothetical protein